MEQRTTVHRVGDATITKVPELVLDALDARFLYPGGNPAVAAKEVRKLGSASVDLRTGLLRISIHAWLVRTPTQVVLVDTAAGNDKDRPGSPVFDHLNEPFIARLRAAGTSPEEVTAVLHTHLHVDHVGWNTHRSNGRWRPAFPSARYIFSGRERAYVAAVSAADGSDAAIRAEANLGQMACLPDPGFYQDSISPVIEAGQAWEVVVDGTEVMEGFSYLPSPGHSIDHACISFASQGERALFWGDVMHNPIQFAQPGWNSVYCEFPDAARVARRWAAGHAADTGSLVLTTHFAGSSAGRVSRDGDQFAWTFA